MESHAESRESEDLVRAIHAGDDRAFDELVRLNQRFVFNLCYRLLGDYDEADDCAQDVFIKLHRSIRRFRFESSFRTWLYRVAVNACKNRFRSRDYRLAERRIRLGAGDPEQAKAVDVATEAHSPARALASKELGRLIQEALDALPPEQKLVVVLRDVEGRSYEEIVEITGLKPGTLKSKLSRARLRLREALEGVV